MVLPAHVTSFFPRLRTRQAAGWVPVETEEDERVEMLQASRREGMDDNR